MNRRGEVPYVKNPMRVEDYWIQQCRLKIDGRFKKYIRYLYNIFNSIKYRCQEVGEGFQFGKNLSLPYGSKLGRYGYIGSGFSAQSPISVGDLTMISTNVTIIDNDHGIDDPNLPIRLNFKWMHKITVFESDVWVGHGVILRAGITVGKGSVIGAGSVVTKDVPPFGVVVGSPARVIKYRSGNA